MHGLERFRNHRMRFALTTAYSLTGVVLALRLTH